jgi:hypothetical protein
VKRAALPDRREARLLASALLLHAILFTGCGRAKPPLPDPGSAEVIAARLETTHGRAALNDLAEEAVSRALSNVANPPVQALEALLQKLDLRKFEHAYFLWELARFPEVGSVPPKFEAALLALDWPAIPDSWSAADRKDAFDSATRDDFPVPCPPGLAAARCGLAKRLWPSVSKLPALSEALERARRTPMKALVEAMTSTFDFRMRVVAEGTRELPERSGGTDVFGQPIRALGITEIPALVERKLALLAPDTFDKLGLGFKLECGSDFKDVPASLEAHYEVTQLDTLYEAFTTHAYAVRLTVTVTLKVGDQEWRSEPFTYEADKKIDFDMTRYNLAEAILQNTLEKLAQDLMKALLKEP